MFLSEIIRGSHTLTPYTQICLWKNSHKYRLYFRKFKIKIPFIPHKYCSIIHHLYYLKLFMGDNQCIFIHTEDYNTTK